MFEMDLRTFLLQCELILQENSVAFSLIQFYISIKVPNVPYSWALASYLANSLVCKQTEKRLKKPAILRGAESVHFNICCVYLCYLIINDPEGLPLYPDLVWPPYIFSLSSVPIILFVSFFPSLSVTLQTLDSGVAGTQKQRADTIFSLSKALIR